MVHPGPTEVREPGSGRRGERRGGGFDGEKVNYQIDLVSDFGTPDSVKHAVERIEEKNQVESGKMKSSEARSLAKEFGLPAEQKGQQTNGQAATYSNNVQTEQAATQLEWQPEARIQKGAKLKELEAKVQAIQKKYEVQKKSNVISNDFAQKSPERIPDKTTAVAPLKTEIEQQKPQAKIPVEISNLPKQKSSSFIEPIGGKSKALAQPQNHQPNLRADVSQLKPATTQLQTSNSEQDVKAPRRSAFVKLEDIEEPFIEEITSKGHSSSSTVGPYSDKRGRISAKDKQLTRVSMIEARREHLQAANQSTAGQQGSFIPTIVPKQAAPHQTPVPVQSQPTVQQGAEDKTVQIIYKQIEGRNYPVGINSTSLSAMHKEFLLKRLLDQEGLTLEDVQNLEREQQEKELNGGKTPGEDPEKMNLAEHKNSDSQGGSGYPGTDYKKMNKQNSLVKGLEYQPIAESEEDLTSNPSRKQSLIHEGSANDDSEEKQFKAPAPVMPKKSEKPKKTVIAEIPEFKPKPKVQKPDVVEDEPFDIQELLRRNEEMMMLIGGDLEETEGAKNEPPPPVQKNRVLRNNLSEKYNAGMLDHIKSKGS